VTGLQKGAIRVTHGGNVFEERTKPLIGRLRRDEGRRSDDQSITP
jgi:hypothetical protein